MSPRVALPLLLPVLQAGCQRCHGWSELAWASDGVLLEGQAWNLLQQDPEDGTYALQLASLEWQR